MKLNPFEIAKMTKNIFKNKDKYVARMEELKVNPIVGISGSSEVIFDIEKNRIEKVICSRIDRETLESIKDAVNSAYDQADQVWVDLENE